jgi:hypothetical protein
MMDMKEAWPLGFALMAFANRSGRVKRMWSLPRKNGEEWFFRERVGPGFYDGVGAALLRAYHRALLLVLLVDAPIAVWLAATARYSALLAEQFVATVVGILLCNVLVSHFSYRAGSVAGESRPETAVQLSMSPRRLLDHTVALVELFIAGATALSLAMAVNAHAVSHESWVTWNAVRWLRSVDSVIAWMLYLQVGLLLLKALFARWRMPLPVRRADDFLKWRAIWLAYYLKLFDGLRLLMALAMLSATFWLTRAPEAEAPLGVGWFVLLLLFAMYLRREKRQLETVARGLKVIELAQEFPRRPVPEGRFVAGWLYVSPGYPGMLVRSGSGIAVNLMDPATYVCMGYLLGLAALTFWITR